MEETTKTLLQWLEQNMTPSFVIATSVALWSTVYTASILVIRLCTFEVVTADEWTQGLASLFLSVGILMTETHGEDVPALQALKVLVLLASLRWTWQVQVRGPKNCLTERLDGKVVLVTGGNSGIGKVTATELARQGATVVLGCRDVKKAEKVRLEIMEETENTNIHVIGLDLGSFESVRKFVAAFNERFDKLDTLVNNAGVMYVGRTVTDDGHEAMMQTNCYSVYLLTVLLMPKLLASDHTHARIVNVSSSTSRMHKTPLFEDMNAEQFYNIFYTYAHGKYILNQLSLHLDDQLKAKEHPVTVNFCHPGVIKTSITRDLHLFFQLGHKFLLSVFFKVAEEGAQTSLSLCEVSKEHSGQWFEHSQMGVYNDKLGEEDLKKIVDHVEEIIGTSAREML